MSIAYWIVAGLTAVAFLGTGLMKSILKRETILQNKDLGWASDFSEQQIKLIGFAEVLGAAGLILPPAFGVAKWLHVPAAIGLVILMLGAANTHRKRKEPVVPPLVLGLLALVSIFL